MLSILQWFIVYHMLVHSMIGSYLLFGPCHIASQFWNLQIPPEMSLSSDLILITNDMTIMLLSLFFVLKFDRYGCPGIEEIESFNKLYKQKLDELIEQGEIPLDLAIEASHPIKFLTHIPD